MLVSAFYGQASAKPVSGTSRNRSPPKGNSVSARVRGPGVVAVQRSGYRACCRLVRNFA
jgi:hypothetical protein